MTYSLTLAQGATLSDLDPQDDRDAATGAESAR
jgi:hypothetical protein